ncbi:streptophobe family protein [Streptomyces sp. NPDC001401]|uniref:streptophobe family protein n=1 Tax=Streptomyces sp. NPDC001401 TaxID=3364570 RepID=UPI0036B8129D
MSASSSVEAARSGTSVPWGDVLLSAIASVSWALIGMAGTAALGLHLLEADAAGSLGPMTAAVVALGAGGSVTPSGDVSAFGLTGAQAHTAVTITPLGVSLVGALLLSWFFLRSLRAAGVVIAPAELLARAGAVVALFVATLGGLAWAGHDVITIDGGSLGLDKLPGGGGGGGVKIPGLGDIGNIGGLLPDNIGNLIHAKAAVGFTVDTAATLLGGLGWSTGILLIALLASRRTPLPRGWEAVHRVVRPAASAIVTVMLMAVVAGFAAAAYAAIGDDHPKRIFGAALLGAPNGTWLGIPIGLFVPFDGKATGELAKLLPDPLDNLLTAKTGQSVTLGRLAELDGRVWLLAVAAAVMMLLAGVLAAVRTPVGAGGPATGGSAVSGAWASGAAGAAASGTDGAWGGGAAGGKASGGIRGPGALGFAGRCALRLGVVTALTLPLLAWLTEVSVDASLSVLGFDAFGAGIELHGHLSMALLLGALWGAGAGAAGALLAWATGAAGRRAAPLALSGGAAGAPAGDAGYPQYAREAGAGVPAVGGERGVRGGASGPYRPSTPYRAPNPATNPYLQLPDGLREPEDARPPDRARQGEGAPPGDGARPSGAPGRGRPSGDARDPGGSPPPGSGNSDMYGAPTVARPIGSPPPRQPRQPPRPRRGRRKSGPDEGPPPPQPPPPPGRPKGDG